MRWKLALAALAVAQCGVASASIVDFKFGSTDGSKLYGVLSYDNAQQPDVNFNYGDVGPFSSKQYEGELAYKLDGVSYSDDVVINTYSYNSADQGDEFLALDYQRYTYTTLDIVLSPFALENALLPNSFNGVSGQGSLDFTNNNLELDPLPGFNHLVSSVPEAATWAMMIGGFGMIGGAMRRKRNVKILFA